MVAATREFSVTQGKTSTKMLGTYSPVGNLDWAVIVQKPRDEAYRGVFEMQRSARLLALMAYSVERRASVFLPHGALPIRWKFSPLRAAPSPAETSRSASN